MPFISAIIATYDRARFLPATVASLTAQSRPPDEILIVDDGSTDDTPAVVGGLDGPIRYLRQENGGKASALNHAMATARGDLVWICDDDDIALPEAAALLEGAIERTGRAFAFGDYMRFTEDAATGTRRLISPGYVVPEPDDVLASLLDDLYFFQMACLVRREAMEAVGPFSEHLARSQDYDHLLRLATRFDGVRIPEVVFLQRIHPGARGPAATRHQATDTLGHWLHHTASVFAAVRRELPLEAYAPPEVAAADPPVRRRAALLKRAVAMGRHELWDEALRDLEAAVRIAGDHEPLAVERRIAGRLLTGKQGACAGLLASGALIGRLSATLSGSPWARTIRREVAGPLVWRIREAASDRRPARAMRFLHLLVRLEGGGPAVTRVGRRVVSRLAGETPRAAR